MFALISPNEAVIVLEARAGYFSPVEKLGRVCEFAEVPFEVAQPLFWVPCDAGLKAQFCYYNSDTNEIVVTPEEPPPFEGIPTATV